MATVKCTGTLKETGEPCDRDLSRCKRCGHEGCNWAFENKCTNQGFYRSTCLKCGKTAGCRPVTTQD